MRGKHLKIFGSLLLALLGVMAGSVSAANAEWVLGGGIGTGTLELKLLGSGFGGEMLITPQGEKINCTAGSIKATLKTNWTMKELTAYAIATLTGCTMLEFPECEVHSDKLPVGKIVVDGGGVGDMPKKPSTVVEVVLGIFPPLLFFDNKLCPFNEFTDGPLEGSVKLVIADAATSVPTHSVTLDDILFSFGPEDVDLHATSAPGVAIKGLIANESSGNWSITLQNL